MNATENKTKRTPGPWMVIPPGREHPSRAMVCGGKGVNIYDAPLTDETEANAKLIAAGPDLLDALRHCLECEYPVTDKDAIRMAEAAIAKAQS